MADERKPSVFDNTRYLTVALCWEKLMEIDDLIAKNGEKPRYTECRAFFARHLERCEKKREGRYDHEQPRARS
jgi:hypothetical protein